MTGFERCPSDQELLCRIRSEYLEMPGLCLTCVQAQRLWALDAATCARLLENLVETRFLHRRVDGQYRRVSDGDVNSQRTRMAKADMDFVCWDSRPARCTPYAS